MVDSEPGGPLIVVVAYCSDARLQGLLRPEAALSNVVVVDNGALSTTAAIAASSGAHYLQMPRNVGFAAAVNAGIEAAWDGERDVLLLNPDALLTAADVQALVSHLHADDSLAAVSPRLVDETGSPQAASWPIPSPASVWLDAVGLGQRWRGRRFVVGAVLLLRGRAVAELGVLDDRYFLYSEETDWQLRALRAGWRVRVVNDVTAVHVGGASSTNSAVRDTHFYTSAEMFAQKWYGRFGAAVMRLGSIVAAFRRSMTGSPAQRAANRRALRMYLRPMAVSGSTKATT